MMPRMLFIWTLVLSLLATIPGMANAETVPETPMKMDELMIQVLPEFAYPPKDNKKNNPPLLISYYGTLRNTSDEPQKGQIRIPLPINDEGFQIGFVGDYSSDLKELNGLEYEFSKNNGVISWVTSEEIEPQGTYKFVIEYYTNSIKQSDKKRNLSYHFKSFADIEIVNFMVVEPYNTDKFVLEPEADSHEQNSYGINMFSYMVQGMKTAEEKAIQLKYERKDKQTTEEILNKVVGSETHQAAMNKEKAPSWKIIFAVGAVTIVLAVILVIFLKRMSKKSHPKKKNQKVQQADAKQAKLRSMLLNGDISQEEYSELRKRFGGE